MFIVLDLLLQSRQIEKQKDIKRDGHFHLCQRGKKSQVYGQRGDGDGGGSGSKTQGALVKTS